MAPGNTGSGREDLCIGSGEVSQRLGVVVLVIFGRAVPGESAGSVDSLCGGGV